MSKLSKTQIGIISDLENGCRIFKMKSHRVYAFIDNGYYDTVLISTLNKLIKLGFVVKESEDMTSETYKLKR